LGYGVLGHNPTIVRCGMALYGCPSGNSPIFGLQPAMHVRSSVVGVRRIAKGDTVGYGGTFVAPYPCTIVTIPVGYGDGYPRELSNKGVVAIQNKRYHIVGSVCMDELMINVGDDHVEIGANVELVGANITAAELAEKAGTIPYTITTGFSKRMPRFLVEHHV
jgi:alanine racemase